MRRIRALILVAGALTLASCNRDDDETRLRVEADRDTVNESALDGLSRQQVERQAEPMSPEQAEQLGVVDTTIHLEDPTINLDSILPVDVPRPSAQP